MFSTSQNSETAATAINLDGVIISEDGQDATCGEITSFSVNGVVALSDNLVATASEAWGLLAGADYADEQVSGGQQNDLTPDVASELPTFTEQKSNPPGEVTMKEKSSMEMLFDSFGGLMKLEEYEVENFSNSAEFFAPNPRRILRITLFYRMIRIIVFVSAALAFEKFLKNLLFVHGREAYRKNGYLVCYNFYKNALYVLPQYWFGFYSAFSG